MKSIHIDIETYSSTDLSESGLYKYSEDPEFKVLLFAYSVDKGPVQIVDIEKGERLPEKIVEALKDPEVIKIAHNANFERVCLSRYLGLKGFLKPEAWRCTMVWAMALGLPASLKKLSKALKLKSGKLDSGQRLIALFSKPDKNGIRKLPKDYPEDWAAFKDYNIQDVKAEIEMHEKLSKLPLEDNEWELYALDQRINDRGVLLDLELVRQALKTDAEESRHNIKRARQISGIDKPRSTKQLKDWLRQKGLDIKSLSKQSIEELLQEDLEPELKEMLSLRLELAKTSVKKYSAMEACACKDARARGLLQFHGARTGRWAGRLVQVQNLPKSELSPKALDSARKLLKAGHGEALSLLYPSTSRTLSALVRTAFIAKPGHRLLVADFSAIEARVIAWLAKEDWRLKVFEEGGDIYCASASQMFKVPVVKGGENGHLRQKGKIAELALGYGGSVGALKAMGALQMGLTEAELKPLVNAWRLSNPNITKLWWEVDKAARLAVYTGQASYAGISFKVESGIMRPILPSGRALSYVRPRLEENAFGGECIKYDSQETGNTRLETYGPKLVENIVQAISRDLLASALLELENAGFKTVMHVHDEVVCEAEEGQELEEILILMSKVPPWAKGLKLKAEGFECDYYRKD